MEKAIERQRVLLEHLRPSSSSSSHSFEGSLSVSYSPSLSLSRDPSRSLSFRIPDCSRFEFWIWIKITILNYNLIRCKRLPMIWKSYDSARLRLNWRFSYLFVHLIDLISTTTYMYIFSLTRFFELYQASACLAGDSAAYQRTSLYGDDVVIVA